MSNDEVAIRISRRSERPKSCERVVPDVCRRCTYRVFPRWLLIWLGFAGMAVRYMAMHSLCKAMRLRNAGAKIAIAGRRRRTAKTYSHADR
jgi:hypothetical protein